jgi:hypothetical protein
VTLTGDELAIVNGALNEVCNGVRDLDDDNEFATRMGVTRQVARDLLAEVHASYDRMNALPSAELPLHRDR